MRKVVKITLFIVFSIFMLLLGAIIYLNSPRGQNFVRGRAEAYLQTKLKTIVHIGHLGYGFPKYIVLADVLFLDEAKDTLLSGGELKIDLSMLKLFHKKVDIQELILKDIHSHIYRNRPDTTYNFSYIMAAFSSNKPQTTTKGTSSSLQIDLDGVKLDDIHVRFDDYTGGMRFAVDLEHLDLKMKKLDLDSMLFHIKDLNVAGLQTYYSQDSSYLPINANHTKTKLNLIADNVNLQRIGLNYDDNLNKFLFGLKLEELQLQLNKFRLADDIIDVKKLVTKNTDIVLTMGSLTTTPAFIDTLIKIDTTNGWNINAGDVDLANVNFKMDDNSQPKQKLGLDYYHLNLKNTVLQIKNFLYTSDTIAGSVKHFSGTEQCGLDVKELITDFNSNPKGATLSNLYFKTSSSLVQDHLEVHYPSVASVIKRQQLLQLKLHIVNSVIGLHDLLMFAPQLKDYELLNKFKNNSSLKVEASITGYLNNMDIAHFYASGLSNTEVLLNGRLSGLPDAKDISYNLQVMRFVSSRKDVSGFIPDSVLSSVRLSDKFGVMGQIAGTQTNYNTDLLLVSTDGRAYIKGTLSMPPGKNKEQYDLFVKTDNLNIGRILKQDSLMGIVSANIKAKGQSFDVKTMAAAIDAEVSGAEIKGYNYHDIKMHATVAQQQGNMNFSSDDSNFKVSLTASGDFTGKYAAVKSDIQIDSVNFKAIKLYSSELRVRGTIHADFPELNPDYPRGRFVWQQPVIVADGKRYFMDSVYVVSNPNADIGQNIIANFDVIQATVTGKTPLTKIGVIIQDHINRHYTFPATDSINNATAITTTGEQGSEDFRIKVKAKSVPAKQVKKDTIAKPSDYNLSLNARVIDKPLLHSLFPGLTSFDSIHVDANLTPRNLALNIKVPNLVYGSTVVQNGIAQIRGSDSAFTYKVTVDELQQSKFIFWYANVHGNLDQNTLTTNISLSDPSDKERFAITASIRQSGDSQVIQLRPGLKLDYNEWTVTEPNRIVLGKGGFYVQNFEISNGGQYIKANSATAKVNTPLKIDITNFMLSNITASISHGDTLLAGGILGATINIDQLYPYPKVTSDLVILQLSVLGDTLGDLRGQVNNNQENVLDTKMTLKGQGNDLALSGSYYLKQDNGNDFNFNLDVNALAPRSFESLAMNEIHNSSGYIRGNLKGTGTVFSPQVTGELHTDNLATTVTRLNAHFKMPAEKMVFSENTVTFNNFNLIDEKGNKAVVNGDIGTKYLPELNFNLTVEANEWRAVHSTLKENKEYYGDLLLTANLTIKGTSNAPYVDGNIFVLKGTKLTITNPDTNPEIQNTKGVVEFVNMRDTSNDKYLIITKKDTVTHKFAHGTDINVNITVNKDAEFSLIIDRASGDFLTVKGEAYLNTAVTPGGVITLSGNYALHSGEYQLNYNFIKRKFLIQDGSSITFAGDPLKGTSLDVTAIYSAKIPPYDLVMRQVPDPAQLNYFKQTLPFEVDLHMAGPVMQPAITFDVQLPENKVYPLTPDQIELVEGKLNQLRTDTAELNKQVFAVLILGRFVSDDPFSSSSTDLQFTAMQSVSTFIGEQLNRAAGKLVKGIDLSADLATAEDYTTGDMRQRTDLNLAASKQLMNDRLKLTVGNDFELEGPQTSNQQSSYLPSNLAADYLLSADGRYTMRVYRKNYDEGVLEGFVTETGLDFIVSFDYNNFKYIFRKEKPKKEEKKLQAND